MSKVLVLLAQGSEELEAVTIVNILRRGGVDVCLAGLTTGPLRGARSVLLMPDAELGLLDTASFDMVVLPGGLPGTNAFKADARVISLVQQMAAQDKYVCAICAAPSVLAEAGLLNGVAATCYPGCLDAYPQVVIKDDAVVESGKIITSRGPGTAMDFALTLLVHLQGRNVANEVEASLKR